MKILVSILALAAVLENAVIAQIVETKILTNDGNSLDRFGIAVDADGDYAIVGAFGDDGSKGSAYIFQRVQNQWMEQAKLTANDGTSGDWFGSTVAINEEFAVVGAWWDDNIKGSAYVFKRDGTNWSQQIKLVAADGDTNDQFGFSVSISGECIIVGAVSDEANGFQSGSAYVFEYDSVETRWNQEAKLTAADGESGDLFGWAVSVDGNYALISASSDAPGAVYVFERDGNTWNPQDKLHAADGFPFDQFGYSVAISGHNAIVGSINMTENSIRSGAAYIFIRENETWTQQDKLIPDDGAEQDLFGYSVAINNAFTVVGAVQDDDNGENSGTAYIFRRDGERWQQHAKLSASDGAAEDWFGNAVSISDEKVIIGAFVDDNENGASAGAAYLYHDFTIVGIDDELPSNPTGFVLEQNYPNPFNPETIIEYDIAKATEVLLTIFNLRGQLVTTLVNDRKAPGHYKITWDGKDRFGQDVSSGVYLYQIRTSAFLQTRKLTLVR